MALDDDAARRRALIRTLSLIYLVAFSVAAASVVVVQVGYHEPRYASIGAIYLAMLCVLWWWLMRLPGGLAPTVVFAVACLGFIMLPDVSAGGALLAVVAAVVLAFFVGTRVALAASVLLCLPTIPATLVSYPQESLASATQQAIVLAMVMLVGCGVGHIMRVAEQARTAAASSAAELARANEALRRSLSLERELVLAEERARSARELHDGLGHRLTLISLSLEFAQRTRSTQPDRAWTEVGTAARAAHTALDEMRLWVRALDPPDIGDQNGSAALEAIAESFRGTGLEVEVRHRGDDVPLPSEVSLFATRFVQEGLTNVMRHSNAATVRIESLQSPQQVRLSLGDDGSGPMPDHEGFGHRSLRERAELLGGTLSRGRSSHGGFELVAVLPIGAVSLQ